MVCCNLHVPLFALVYQLKLHLHLRGKGLRVGGRACSFCRLLLTQTLTLEKACVRTLGLPGEKATNSDVVTMYNWTLLF